MAVQNAPFSWKPDNRSANDRMWLVTGDSAHSILREWGACVGDGELGRYLDHCWYSAMEVGESAPLPAVNRELEQAWKQATRGGSQDDVMRRWKNYLDRRSRVLQSQDK